MIYLSQTTDKLQLVTSSTATINVNCNYIDASSTTLAASAADKQNTAITTATTTDILAAPAGSTVRTLKQMFVRNNDASLSCVVSVRYNQNATTFDLHKVTLAAGDELQYIEGAGFLTIQASSTTTPTSNANTGDITANAVDTYLSGASLNVTNLIQVGSIFSYKFAMTKTAAGVAAPIFTARFGTNGSTADTGQLTFTLPSIQTAATDTGWAELEIIVRTHSSTGIMQGVLRFDHKNTTTGLASTTQVQIVEVTSSTFNTTVAGSILGISVNPGSSGVWTFQMSRVFASGTTISR